MDDGTTTERLTPHRPKYIFAYFGYTVKKIASYITIPENIATLDLGLTEKVKILLGHDGPEKIPKSVILLNKRTELLQKCRHRRKFTYAGFKTRKWNYENPGNPTGTDDDNQR